MGPSLPPLLGALEGFRDALPQERGGLPWPQWLAKCQVTQQMVPAIVSIGETMSFSAACTNQCGPGKGIKPSRPKGMDFYSDQIHQKAPLHYSFSGNIAP